MDGCDVGVVHRRQPLRPASEARHAVSIVREGRRQSLERYLVVEFRFPRAVTSPMPPAPMSARISQEPRRLAAHRGIKVSNKFYSSHLHGITASAIRSARSCETRHSDCGPRRCVGPARQQSGPARRNVVRSGLEPPLTKSYDASAYANVDEISIHLLDRSNGHPGRRSVLPSLP